MTEPNPTKVRKKLKRNENDPAYNGIPKPFTNNQLPTYQDVGLALEFYSMENNMSKISLRKVTKDLIDIYKKCSIPTISELKIYQKVQKLIELRRVKMKELKIDQRTGKSVHVGKFRKKAKNGKVKVHLSDILGDLFPAADEANVPEIERAFLEDQKTERKMIIGGTDLLVTKRNNNRIKKKNRETEKRMEEEKRKSELNEVSSNSVEFNCDDTSDSLDSEDEYLEPKETFQKRKRMTIAERGKLKNVFETADRFGLSDTATAHMVNVCSASLHDNNKNSPDVFYQTKVRD